jgi:hypothetical protein
MAMEIQPANATGITQGQGSAFSKTASKVAAKNTQKPARAAFRQSRKRSAIGLNCSRLVGFSMLSIAT